MKIEIVKIIALASLLLLTFLFSMLPLTIIRRIRGVPDTGKQHTYARLLSLLSCCGGGVFLATCLLHLFPEAQKQLEKALSKSNVSTSFPLAEFVMTCGFLIVLITEQVVLSCKEDGDENLPLLGHSHQHSNHSHSHVPNGHTDDITDNSPSVLEGSSNMEASMPRNFSYSIHEDPSSHSSLRSVLLVMALSLHSIFEGLAIGLQPTSEDVIRILTAVLIHKCIIAFTLGLNLVQSRLKKSTIINCNILFSVMAPIGLAIGLGIMDAAEGVTLAVTTGILEGVASGTFLYVTFFEVLPHEMNASEDRMLKLLFLIFGYSAYSILTCFLPS